MKTKLLIITSILLLILIGSVQAGLIDGIGNVIGIKPKPIQCDAVSLQDATETITTKIQVQATEDKIILDKPKLADVLDFGSKLTVYNKLSSSQKALTTKPTLSSVKSDILKNNTKAGLKIIKDNTIKVPLFETKTRYRFDFVNWRIVPYKVKVPIMEEQTITTNKIKDGYHLNESDGNFYNQDGC